MFNSRLFSTILIILSIASMIVGGIFFYKKENTNILKTNYGTVNLGKVYSEKVFIEVEIQGFLNDSKEFESLAIAPFFDPMKEINKVMVKNFELLNSYKDNETKISYENAKPIVDMKLRLTTKIQYHSKNYNNEPFTFGIHESEYTLKKGENLKNNIEKSIKENFVSVEKDVINSLFLTETENLDGKEK